MLFFKSKKNEFDSDLELIERYRNSHELRYVGEVYHRYTHLVFGVCMKYLKNEEDSKDAVMEIFEKLMEELKRHQVENFKSWLFSLTRNFCLMRLRKEKSARKNEEGYQKYEAGFVDSDEWVHLFTEKQNGTLSEKLSLGINTLKTEQKKCISLFYFEGKSYDQIAGETGYSQKQVKSFLQNGKRNLKIYLEKQDD